MRVEVVCSEAHAERAAGFTGYVWCNECDQRVLDPAGKLKRVLAPGSYAAALVELGQQVVEKRRIMVEGPYDDVTADEAEERIERALGAVLRHPSHAAPKEEE